ncbi:hypothetical protein SDC9_153506 [bioreactor metagenome]|uniref:Uncharacterized protein n=1 Tax=bioreactor metagenome TaxID=1076179 RepID=A0A645EXQ7_9ZZZZ
MIAPAKLFADVLHRHAGDLVHDVHRGLACRRNITAAFAAANIRRGDVVGARHLADDFFDRDRHRLVFV